MHKIHMICFLLPLLITACRKNNDSQRSELSQEQLRKLAATRPTMYMQFDDISSDFDIAQMLNNGTSAIDTNKNAVRFYGADNLYALLIKIPGDTIVPGQYELDGIKGTVSLLRNGGIEIARLNPAGYFYINVWKDSTGFSAVFSGTLERWSTGRMSPIEGGMHAITGFY